MMTLSRLYPDGRIQHAGVVIGLGGVAGHVYRLAAADARGYLDRLRSVHEVSAVTAACLLVRKSVYEEVGGPLGRKVKSPFVFTNVKGTIEAGGFSVYLLGYREPDPLGAVARQMPVPQLRSIPRIGLQGRRRARQHAEEVRELTCC